MGCNIRRTGGPLGNSFTVGSGQPGAVPVGLVETYQVAGVPCNLEYVYVHVASALPNGNFWLHIFDMNPTLGVQTLSQVMTGQAPLYIDTVPAAGKLFVWEPPSDYVIRYQAQVDQLACEIDNPVGAPFDVGVIVGLSSTEFTYTPAGALLWVTARYNTINCVPMGACRR